MKGTINAPAAWRRSKATKRNGEYQRRISQVREVNVSAWLRAVELDDVRDKVPQ